MTIYRAPIADDDARGDLEEFVEVHVIAEEGGAVFAADLWQRYLEWCDEPDVDVDVDERLKPRQMTRLLREAEFLGAPGKADPLHWRGFRLATPEEAAEAAVGWQGDEDAVAEMAARLSPALTAETYRRRRWAV